MVDENTRVSEGIQSRYERQSEDRDHTELERIEHQLRLTHIDNKKHYQYIGFWLVCITFILAGILITLLKQ